MGTESNQEGTEDSGVALRGETGQHKTLRGQQQGPGGCQKYWEGQEDTEKAPVCDRAALKGNRSHQEAPGSTREDRWGTCQARGGH